MACKLHFFTRLEEQSAVLVENTAEEKLTYRRGCNPRNHFLLFSKTSSYFNIFNLARTKHKFTKFLLSFFQK